MLNEAYSAYEKRTTKVEPDNFDMAVFAQQDFLQQFDAIKADKEDFERNEHAKNEIEMRCRSELPPSGFTVTNTKLHKAAGRIVEQARHHFGDSSLKACVWAYRHDDCLMLSCDLFAEGDEKKSMPVTITASEELELSSWDEPEVYDMAEAVHLAGLITKALDAKVIIGRGSNETNPAVLIKPLEDKQTNGEIYLWQTT